MKRENIKPQWNAESEVYKSLTPELRAIEQEDVTLVCLESYDYGYSSGIKKGILIGALIALYGISTYVVIKKVCKLDAECKKELRDAEEYLKNEEENVKKSMKEVKEMDQFIPKNHKL